jgi:hypothetical protein
MLFWVGSRIVRSDQDLAVISYASPDNQAHQVLGDVLPDEPSPVIVTDQRGRSKWTISIPPALKFPLKPERYASICDKSMEMSQHVEMQKKPNSDQSQAHTAHHGYYYEDPHFMDIADAEAHNLLPGISSAKRPSNLQDSPSSDAPLEPCDRSLTYALETSSAGLGHTLLTIWLAYGLAQSENRAFFIDDTNWPYGSYSTYFKPPPPAGCLPPPRTQIVPCPHQARHLIVSAGTTRHTFGHTFMDHFEDGRKMGVMRQRKIFGMMRTGYEALFQGMLNDEDQAYIDDRVGQLNNSSRNQGGEEIGVHVRHGDRHPLEYQYQKSYIPLEKYLDTAHNLTTTQSSHTQILIASDDPDIYIDPLITSPTDPTLKIEKAQSHITLASKKTLAASGQAGLGWEGGFFKDVFWALGLPVSEQIPRIPDTAQPSHRSPEVPTSSTVEVKRVNGAQGEEELDPHKHPSAASLKLRELIGRAYLLDLAVLGQSDKIVCAVSGYGCRILAVMMGWEKAIVNGGWVSVDGDFDWRGVDW